MGSTQSTWGRMGIASLARTNLPQSSIHSAAHSLTVRSKTRCHKSLAKRLREHSRDSLRVVTLSFPAGWLAAPPTSSSGHELCMPRSRLQGSNLARRRFSLQFSKMTVQARGDSDVGLPAWTSLGPNTGRSCSTGLISPGGPFLPQFFEMIVHAGNDPSVGPPAWTNLGPKTVRALMSLL